MQKNEINIETVVKIIKKLYWLGLIGIAGSAFDIPILKLFYLFFLLAIIDFILSLIIVLRTEGTDETVNDLKFLFQNLGMLIGIPFIYIRNMFQLPNVDTYTPEIHYSLPFGECWTVANGGNNKETQIQQGKSFLLSASLPIWFEKIRNHSISNSPHISRGDIVENE